MLRSAKLIGRVNSKEKKKQIIHTVLFVIDLINLFIHYVNLFNKNYIIHTNKKHISKG